MVTSLLNLQDAANLQSIQNSSGNECCRLVDIQPPLFILYFVCKIHAGNYQASILFLFLTPLALSLLPGAGSNTACEIDHMHTSLQ
jgi:hypothetical protein